MDNALKQRMVGASVLIALAVIVLPMLLGGRPEGSAPEPEKIELPKEPPELSFETRRYPIGETADQKPEPDRNQQPEERSPQLPAPRIPTANELPEPVVADDDPAGEASENGLEVTGLGPAPGDIIDEEAPDALPGKADDTTATVTEPVAIKPEVVSPPPVSTTGRYIVQVASFGAADNANRLSDQLVKGGYAVLNDTDRATRPDRPAGSRRRPAPPGEYRR